MMKTVVKGAITLSSSDGGTFTPQPTVVLHRSQINAIVDLCKLSKFFGCQQLLVATCQTEISDSSTPAKPTQVPPSCKKVYTYTYNFALRAHPITRTACFLRCEHAERLRRTARPVRRGHWQLQAPPP